MTHPDPGGGNMTIAVLLIVFTAGAIIPISITWIQSRAKMKAIEVLKAYAEKGQEPPAGILEAMGRVSSPFPPGGPPPPSRPTRSDHWAHMAGSIGLALGAGAVILWRWPVEHDHPGWMLITAVFVAIFFAASAAARLAWALTTDDGGR
jgi:hypothetical protein